ncbi:MAG TPA: hypothetical protein VL101_04565, partial [Nordella sp.]|nr:hypothetical protein [Nordella sp.]
AASKRVHGFARLGDAGGGICTAQGMDSIDATSAGEDILGHSNFTTSKVMLDIYDVIVNRRTTSQGTFSLLPVGNPPTYWQIKP